MFNYCVWFCLNRGHHLSKLVLYVSSQLNTYPFQAHITIEKNLTYLEADHIYKHQCAITKPWFRISGNVYQTNVKIGENIFYAIQQDYYMYDIKKLGEYHVSLAYRLNTPFTKEEIAFVQGRITADTIWSHDIKVSLNDCRSMKMHQLKICLF